MFSDISPQDVRAAADRIAPLIVRTPLIRSQPLSHRLGIDVHLKLELQQTTGSFKLRGALNAIASLPPDVAAIGVFASSAGNHGLGIAYAARTAGIPATIYVPRSAPLVKKEGIRKLGAAVIDSEADYDAAMVAAKAHAAASGATYINPCLGDPLLAGQGTVAVEIMEQLPQTASILLPVGGGGLLGGVAAFIRNAHPGIRILGAQSVNTAAMARSVAAGRVVDIDSVPTLADGLAGQIDAEALAIGRWALDDIVTVSEHDIASAIAFLAREHNLYAEGAGAVSIAPLLTGALQTPPAPLVIIISGGNIDRTVLDSILH